MTSTLLSNIFVLVLIVIQLFASYLIRLFPLTPAIWNALSGTLFLLLPSILYIYYTKQNFKSAIPTKPLGLKNILLLFAFALLIQPSMGLLGGLSTFVFPNEVSDFVQELNKLPFLYALFVVGISPAICEEFAFRGVFASGYKNTDIHKAAFMNGLMFAFMHLNGQQFLYAFAMGILFMYIVYITGSIFSSIFMHFVFNTTQLLLSRWSATINTDTAAAQAALGLTETQLLLRSLAFYGFVALITLPFLYLIFKALMNTNKQSYENIILEEDCDNLSDSMIVASTTKTYSPDYEIILKKPIRLSKEKVFNWPVVLIIILYILLVIVPMFEKYIG